MLSIILGIEICTGFIWPVISAMLQARKSFARCNLRLASDHCISDEERGKNAIYEDCFFSSFFFLTAKFLCIRLREEIIVQTWNQWSANLLKCINFLATFHGALSNTDHDVDLWRHMSLPYGTTTKLASFGRTITSQFATFQNLS